MTAVIKIGLNSVVQSVKPHVWGPIN